MEHNRLTGEETLLTNSWQTNLIKFEMWLRNNGVTDKLCEALLNRSLEAMQKNIERK